MAADRHLEKWGATVQVLQDSRADSRYYVNHIYYLCGLALRRDNVKFE